MSEETSLEKLPLEVIQQIFSYLPTSDLASVRQCSSYLSLYATSNHLWQSRCQALWRRYVTLQDCRAIPAKLWSFSCVPNGWFRAYITIIRIARDDWLTCDDDLKRNVFMVFFKSHLGDNVGAEHWHALVKFEEDGMVHPIDGLPLYSNVWSVDEMKTLRVPGYPPNVPSRDPRTWCRVLQHIHVLMLSDSPEFFKALLELNDTIMSEIRETLTLEVRESMESAFKKARDTVLRTREAEQRDTFRRILLVRNGIQKERERERSERDNQRSVRDSGAACSQRQTAYSPPVINVFMTPIANTTTAGSTTSHPEIADNSRDSDKSSEG